MDASFLDLIGEKSTDILGPLSSPFPDNLNVFDPSGHQDRVWHSIGDMIGLDLQRSRSRGFSGPEAVGLSIAVQCADVVARDLAKSEMVLWRKGTGRRYTEVESDGHWFAKMLARRPNPWMTWGQFWRMTGIHLGLAQNAYIVPIRSRSDQILWLIPVKPAYVQAVVSEEDDLFYDIYLNDDFMRLMFGVDRNDYQTVRLRAEQIIHFKGTTWNGLMGLSNTDLGAPIFSLMSEIAEFQKNTFGNQGKVLVAFETDQAFTGEMGDQHFNRLKRDLDHRMASGKPFLLEAGLKAKVLSSNARESMAQDAFNSMTMRICGLMQVPPHKIMAYETVKYENMASADNQYANDTLVPLAENIEETLRFGILRDNELDTLYPEFDRMAMMAGDMKTLSEVLDTSVKNGVITLNEARERLPLALNPVPFDDRFLIPVNTAMVDAKTGKVIQQVAEAQMPGAGQEPGKPNPAERQSFRVVSSQE